MKNTSGKSIHKSTNKHQRTLVRFGYINAYLKFSQCTKSNNGQADSFQGIKVRKESYSSTLWPNDSRYSTFDVHIDTKLNRKMGFEIAFTSSSELPPIFCHTIRPHFALLAACNSFHRSISGSVEAVAVRLVVFIFQEKSGLTGCLKVNILEIEPRVTSWVNLIRISQNYRKAKWHNHQYVCITREDGPSASLSNPNNKKYLEHIAIVQRRFKIVTSTESTAFLCTIFDSNMSYDGVTYCFFIIFWFLYVIHLKSCS